MNAIKQRPLAAFFVVAFGFSWALCGLVISGLLPLAIGFVLATFGPTVAAAFVSGVGEGGTGLRRWARGYTRWRVAPVAYLLALSPVAVVAATVGANALLGGDTPRAEAGLTVGYVLASLLSAVVIGALGEEGGWRGFALPRLQQSTDAVRANLILGGLWALWHVPAWFLPGTPQAAIPFVPWVLYLLGATIVIGAAYNLAGGSILVAILAHWAFNFAGSSAIALGWISVERFFTLAPLAMMALAAALVIVLGPRRLGQPEAEVATPPAERRHARQGT
jgi:membrane protease YdiL (CAAX protease family)